VALSEVEDPGKRVIYSYARPEVVPHWSELDDLAAELNRSQKTTILAGAGCAGAHEELVELAGKLQAPIVHTLRGKEFVEHDNPFSVGMTGLLGLSSGYCAMMDCDTLLMLGTDFPYRQFYPPKARVVQIDIRVEQLGRRVFIDLGIVGGVAETLRALLPRIESKRRRSHLDALLDHYRQARMELDDMAIGNGERPIRPQYVARMIDELAAEDAVFAVDVGTPVVWAARYLTMNGRRRLLGSFNHGSIANGLPQAIGAQVSHSGRQVVTLCGDSGVSLLMGDLLSLRHLNLPVKIVVFNNGSLGFVEPEMQAAGILSPAPESINLNFAKIAEGAGIFGLRVDDPQEVRPALERAFAHDGPALVDVAVNRQELAMPLTLKMDEVADFNLYMIKAILNGRGGEIADLGQTNLIR
jgi:pyruvate dehydrogenase (quinone)